MRTVSRATISQSPSLIPLVEAKTRAFMVTHYEEPVFHFVWHYHREFELCWVRRGTGLRYVGGSVEHFEPGDLVLIGSAVPHAWASTEGAPDAADWTVVQFHPDNWGLFWQLPELQKLRTLLSKAGRGLRFPNADDIGSQIEELVRTPPHSIESLVQFLMICQRLIQAPHQPLNAVDASVGLDEPDPRMQHVLDWLDRRMAEPITQAEAAAEVKMSPAAFSRWFKERFGRVFQRYVNEARVARVCARLAGSQETITQAAFKCGYNNLANFNRRFREITGLTPSQFRGQTLQMQRENARAFLMRLGHHSAVRIK